jgi:hypothetical protein
LTSGLCCDGDARGAEGAIPGRQYKGPVPIRDVYPVCRVSVMTYSSEDETDTHKAGQLCDGWDGAEERGEGVAAGLCA